MSHFDGLLPFADALTVIGAITVLSAFFAGLFWLADRLDKWAQKHEQPQETEEVSEALLDLKAKWQDMAMEQH